MRCGGSVHDVNVGARTVSAGSTPKKQQRNHLETRKSTDGIPISLSFLAMLSTLTCEQRNFEMPDCKLIVAGIIDVHACSCRPCETPTVLRLQQGRVDMAGMGTAGQRVRLHGWGQFSWEATALVTAVRLHAMRL